MSKRKGEPEPATVWDLFKVCLFGDPLASLEASRILCDMATFWGIVIVLFVSLIAMVGQNCAT